MIFVQSLGPCQNTVKSREICLTVVIMAQNCVSVTQKYSNVYNFSFKTLILLESEDFSTFSVCGKILDRISL
jgi:hypothetical protein